MTPTDFEFTMTMPGDARLVAAVRQLATQAAGYAQLPPARGERLAVEVERATAAAIEGAPDAPIHVRFTGTAAAIAVVISRDAVAAAALPASTTSEDVTVDWQRDGTRQTCHISQPIPA